MVVAPTNTASWKRHFPLAPGLCCAAVLLLCGCAALFSEQRVLVDSIPAGPSGVANIKLTLKSSTRYIELHAPPKAASDQRFVITIINHGRSGFEAQRSSGRIAPLDPNQRAELYAGPWPSANPIRLKLSGIRHRTPCELEVQASNPAQFPQPVRIYLFNSSAPM
jgi:hypothetical protein